VRERRKIRGKKNLGRFKRWDKEFKMFIHSTNVSGKAVEKDPRKGCGMKKKVAGRGLQQMKHKMSEH